jgi:hypothetical protein
VLHAEALANIKAGLSVVSALLNRAKAGHLTASQFVNDKALSNNASREQALWKKLGAAVCAKP